MRQWQLRSPNSAEEWQQYFLLRWQMLRQPWQQPLGSEQDELEQQAYHLMLVNNNGDIGAIGRIHLLSANIGQIRYMAVAATYQGKGLGSKILQALERKAAELGCYTIRLNARDTALGFYQSHGYQSQGVAPALYGISHTAMNKTIRLSGSAADYQEWCDELCRTWQQTIPLSQFMQLGIAGFDGNELRCQAPLSPNINLHHTMFAGSIYSLATLTGWGMLYLQLQALGLSGDQVLADASMRYLRPVAKQPNSRCYVHQCRGDLTALAEGKKVSQYIRVQIFSQDELAAEFTGRYAVLPHGPELE